MVYKYPFVCMELNRKDMQKSVDKALLRSYFDGTCTPEQGRVVEAWLAKESHTAEEVKLLEEIFNSVEAHPSQPDAETVSAFAEVSAQIKPVRRKVWLRRIGYAVSAVAAAVMILLTIPFSLHKMEPKAKAEPADVQMIVAYAPFGESQVVELPDGSIITLAADSRLSYPAQFDGETRRVELVGECFASIAKNPEKPFILNTGKIDIVVTGTQFNVKSHKGTSEVEVALVEGSVIVERKIEHSANDKEQIALVAGQMVKIDNGDGKALISRFDPELYAAVSNQTKKPITFLNQRFCDITAELEREFNVRIKIMDDELLNERFYATFINNESLDDILSTFNAGGTMNISKKNEVIYISLRKQN